MKTRLLLGLGLLAAATFLSAACGDDDDAKPAATATGSGPSAAAQETRSASAPAASASAATGGGQVTGPGADALKKLTTDLGKKTYQVAYEFNRSATGGSTAGTKGTVTISQKPPKSAFRIETPDAGGQSIVIINDGKDSYFCIKGATPEGLCTKSTGAGGLADLANFANVNELIKNLEGKTDVTEVKGQTIAGRDARCFDVKNSGASGGTSTACFDKSDGLLLLSQTPGSDGFSLKATSVATSVDDKSFDLPYKVQALPSIPSLPGASATATR